jgi:hypothetical protein
MSWNHDGAGQAEATGVECLGGLYSYELVLTRNHAERSRHTGDGEVASGQQHQGLALHNPEKCLAQPVEKVAQWSSNDWDGRWRWHCQQRR